MTLTSRRFRAILTFVGPRIIWSLALLWVLALVFFALEIAFAFLLQQFLAGLGVVPPIARQILPPELSTTWVTTALLAVVSIARVAVGYGQLVIDGSAAEQFCHQLRVQMIGRSLRSTAVDSGATLTFFHQTILNASITLRAFHQLVAQTIICIGLAVVLLAMSPRLTAIFLLIGACGWLPLRILHHRARRSASRQKETFDRLMKSLGNVFRNVALIRLHNLQDRERGKFESHLRVYTADIRAYFRAEGAASALGPLFVVVGIVGVALGQRNAFVAGSSLVPYLYLFIRLGQQVGPFAANATRVSGLAPDFMRTFEWWYAEQHEARSDRPAPPDPRPVRQAIGWHLERVTFGYEGQPSLFADFSLRVRPGSFVHIAGESGSGKTTLLALMVGEVQTAAGRVEVDLDGERVAVADALPRLRDHLGYSTADPYLFAGTLYDNVVDGLREPPSEALLREMVACACCEFIFQTPNGFSHRIDEHGHGLSAGQQQRLSLLRALLRQPRALVLDEALSNVDDATEARILKNVMALRPACTTLWISHRSHDIVKADERVELSSLSVV